VSKTKVRLGNLAGVSNASGYGLYTQNAFLTGALVVGDLTKTGNYLEYNGSSLNVVTDTFSLTVGSMTIDSTNGVVVDASNFFKQDSTFSFGGGLLSGTSTTLDISGSGASIDVDTFTLQTTNLTIDSSNELISVGSASPIKLGKLSTAVFGLEIDTHNYWKLQTGQYSFKAGDANEYVSYDTTNGLAIKIGDDDLSTAIADIRSDLIDIYLADQSTFAGIQFLSGQITLKVGADGKVASARLDATGDESAITLRADFFDFQSNDIVILGDPDQDAGTEAKIALGSNVDTITVANTDSGFIASGAGEFKGYIDANNYLRLDSTGLDIKAEVFDLKTSFIQIADTINKTSSTLTSSVAYSGDLSLDGLFFDEDNYFGYLTDVEAIESNGYVFRVGGNTSDFIELNSANNIFKVETDVVKINNTRSTFPSVKTSQSLSNTTNYTFDGGSTNGAIEVNHIDNGVIRFYFNIDQTAIGIAFLDIEVEIEGYNGSSWVALTAFDESPELIALDGYGNSGLIIKNDSSTVTATNQTTSSKVAVQYQGDEVTSHTFDGYLYLKTQTNNTFTKYRMNFSDNGIGIGYTTTLDAHGAISYKPVFEQNTAGSWVRLADAIYSVDDGLERRTIIDDTLI
jgi:hypothetical protein